MKSLISIKEKPKSIVLKYRTENGIFEEEIQFNNYFYIDAIDLEVTEEILSEFDVKYVKDGKYIKIILSNNYDRKKIVNLLHMNNIKTKEGDLSSNKRYMIDNELKINAEGLNYLFYDIETLDIGKMEKDINNRIVAITPILSIAYIDNKGNKFYIKNENKKNPLVGEKILLRKHLELIRNYDIILGWNSSGFDDTYVIQRAEYHNLDVRIYYEINRLDYMKVVEKNVYPKPQKMSLDYVSQELLNIGKVNIQEKGNGGIYRLWKQSFEEKEHDFDELIEKYNTDYEINSLKSYNFKDVYLMYLIEQKFEFLQNHVAMSNYLMCEIEQTINNSELWDIINLRDIKKYGIKAPTKYNINLDGKFFVMEIEYLDEDKLDIKTYTCDGDKL